MSKINLLLLFTFLLFSCENNNLATDNGIVGKWNWISTDGGLGFHIHDTPLSTEKNIVLFLAEDNTYSITENNDIILEGTYRLSYKESIYTGEMELFISILDNFSSPAIITGIINIANKTELEIADNWYDGVGSGYKRID